MLQGPGHVADVGRRAQNEAVGGEHVGDDGREGGPDYYLDPVEVRVAGPGDDGLEHGLQRG
jgi:hypothetical protein